ncbi:TadE/TadG family type IV pilus assembly protein [Brevundimonas sp.]|uniref:TadE/TadG family type IV pilus assembly protein n=1 Tax=Brevundimonas sp. TaxID=1871086 RepID=UPI003AF4A28F
MVRAARARTALDRFLAARRGSTAVEFAMVAAPFFFMMFAVLELAFVFVLDSALENAVIETGRLVRTGQASSQSFTANQFKTALCSRMSIFSADCMAKVTVDVREIPQFTNPNPPDPTAGSTFSEAGLGYTNGNPGSLMLVRGWYRHQLFTPFLSQGLSRMGDGKAILTATTAFRNEPWR